ncbi:NGFI-A-binding protein 2 isoform X1 [Conger conger]|uniref:NGFI-A-binding protein 2 isoform X1 n=1 Tax=Conger conger TaxID=82655 RepID=UPI002A5AA413|nr:NGFI-A-binding protein 2 isoform X1 [Conger conger]XP_061076057.1 NGFI-A-binding protein 2 isoform X1 [Conger conger]
MSLPRTLGELQLYRVLQRANLLAYYDTFIQQGGDDVQQLCEAGEEEFLEIMALVGMATKPLHVRRLQKALRDWAASPALFNQPLANLPMHGVPLFKVEAPGGTASSGARKSLSNGHAGSPGEREERASLTPLRSISPKSPCSQTSPLPPDSLDRDRLSPAEPHWPKPDPDPDGSMVSGTHEGRCSPAPSSPPAASSSQASAWSGGRTDPETAQVVGESVEKLLSTVPRGGSAEAKSLLKLNKKLAKTLGHIFDMDPQDPSKEEEIRKYSLIYGRFDSKRREGKHLTHHEMIINEAAAQFCIHDNALLLRRVELFSLARQVARECAYTSTLKNSRPNADDSPLPPQKKIKQEETMSECVSSYSEGSVTGSESGHQGALRSGVDEESLSGESQDGMTPADAVSQPSQSPSLCPAPNASAPPTWNRHLMQQTLVDEGLRLAKLVSHDQAGTISPGAGIQTTEPEN